MFDLAIASQILWTSFATSSYFVLFALAFALVLKVNKVFNFAQAAIMSVAFYSAYVAVRVLGLNGVTGLIACLAGGILTAVVIEVFGFAKLRTRKASPMFVFIFTLVVSQFVSYVLMLIFGTWPTTIFPTMFWPVSLVGGIAISAWDVPALAAMAAILIALWAFLRFTRWGQFMIAVADNPDLAELYGIQKNRVMVVSMAIAGAICAAGMFLYGTRAQVQPSAATELMLFAVAATIIGGIGNLWGAAIAAIVLGLVQNSSILFIPSAWQGFLLYAFLFLAIVLFPRGFHWPERASKLKRKTIDALPASTEAKGG